MPLTLEFQTKYILSPWSMSFNPAKVLLMAFEVLFKILSTHCVIWFDLFTPVHKKLILLHNSRMMTSYVVPLNEKNVYFQISARTLWVFWSNAPFGTVYYLSTWASLFCNMQRQRWLYRPTYAWTMCTHFLPQLRPFFYTSIRKPLKVPILSLWFVKLLRSFSILSA